MSYIGHWLANANTGQVWQYYAWSLNYNTWSLNYKLDAKAPVQAAMNHLRKAFML